jgi:hypothetical protein
MSGEAVVTEEPNNTGADFLGKTQAEHELVEHCLVFYEVYEADLKMIQDYLNRIDDICEIKYQSAYSHWRKLLQDMRQGVRLIKNRTPMNNIDDFQESLRTFSFTSTARFLRDIGNICGVQLDRQWTDRFQAHVLLIMQSQQEMLYNQNSSSSDL